MIPWEILGKDAGGCRLYIGVYGVRGEEIVFPTVWADAGIVQHGANPGFFTNPPTPDVYQQILAELAAEKASREEIRKALDALSERVEALINADGAVGGAQSDWDEPDERSPAFIKNKPFGGIPFNVSWNGADTGEHFESGSGILLYKVSDAAPPADEISNVSATLRTVAGDIEVSLTPVYAGEYGMTLFYEYQYSGGEQPVMVCYDGNVFGAAPGVYIADLAALTTALSVPISGVTLSWTQVKKIDQKYLPFGTEDREVVWDGDTSGRDQFSFNLGLMLQFYKISDLTPTSEELVTGNIKVTGVSEEGAFAKSFLFDTDNMEDQIEIASIEKGMYGVVLNYALLPIVFVAPAAGIYTYSDETYDVPSAGIYCIDLSAAAGLMQIESINSINLTYTSVRKIDPVYLPTEVPKVGRYKGTFALSMLEGTLDAPIDESCDMISLLLEDFDQGTVILTFKRPIMGGGVEFSGIIPSTSKFGLYSIIAQKSEFRLYKLFDLT